MCLCTAAASSTTTQCSADGGWPATLARSSSSRMLMIDSPRLLQHLPPRTLSTQSATPPSCIASTYDIVCFADACMVENGCASSLNGLLLQIPVAVALKHRNIDMLCLLLMNSGPPTAMFMADPALFASVLDDPNYGRKAWALLSSAGWAVRLTPPVSPQEPAILPDIDACYALILDAVLHDNGHSALAVLDNLVSRGFTPIPYTARILQLLVTKSSADMVVRFLALVARTGTGGYDGIPPRSKWPGSMFLVTLAASRADAQGPAVLRALVNIGGMNIHTCISIWYKESPNDDRPMSLSGAIEFRRLPDGSCADDPPLLAAVHAGNVDSVAFLVELLRKYGATDQDNILGQAVEKAKECSREDILPLLGATRLLYWQCYPTIYTPLVQSLSSTAEQQLGAAEARRAHNPEVP